MAPLCRITQLAGTGVWVSLRGGALVEVEGINCWPTLELVQSAMYSAGIPQSDMIMRTSMPEQFSENRPA